MRDYDAFISYSHRADNFRAAALQRGLQNLGRPFYRRKHLNVFRDETSLSSNPGLWPSIERALDRSRYFVLMASPESAASQWCVKEVEWWLANRSIDTFLIVVSGGDLAFDESIGDFDWARTTALSHSLQGKFPVEPFFRDLRWAQREDNLSLTNTRFRAEVLPLAAALHGMEPQELDGEDLRQFRRSRLFWRSAAVALAMLTIVSAAAAWIAIAKSREAMHQRGVAVDAERRAVLQRDAAVRAQQAESRALVAETKAREAEEQERLRAEAAQEEAVKQRDEAIRQRNVAVARQLAIKAEFLQKDKAGLLHQSMLLAAESLRRAPSLEADRTLRRGLALLPRQVAEARYRPYLNSQGLSAASDGRVAFMTLPDGEIRVIGIDSEKFQDMARWTPPARVFHLAFDKVSGNIAIGSKGVYYWDLRAGEPRKVLDCEAHATALHMNLLAAGCESESLRMIDVVTGKITEGDDETRDITGMAFNSDGTRLAAAHADGTLTMWQVDPWKQLFRTADKYDGGIHATTLVAFDSFDDVVTKATARDKMIRVYDARDGHVISTLVHPDIVLALDITARGRLVATAGADGTARVFDGATGGLITEMRHQAAVRDVRFAEWNQTRVVVTASEDNTARIWRIDGGREIARATAAAPIGLAAPQFFENNVATLSYDGVLRLWNMQAEEEHTIEWEMVPSINTVWSEAQKAFVVAYRHWHANRIDPEKKRGGAFFGEGEGLMKAEAAFWSADGRFVLWGKHEQTQVWDAIAKRKLADVQHPYADAWALSADGKTFAVQDSAALRVYRVGHDAPLLNLKAGALGLRKGVAVSATHVAAIVDNDLVLRSLANPESKPVTIRGALPDRLMFSPDGRMIAWAGYQPGVFDVQAGRRIALNGADKSGADTIAFSADGRRIAMASDERVGIWSLPTGGRLASLTLEAQSSSMAFARDGRTLAVGGEDGTTRVWSVADGAELARIAIAPSSPGAAPPPITATALSANGEYLLTGTANSSRVWVVDSHRLIAQACRRLPNGLSEAEWHDYIGSEKYRLTCGDSARP